MFNIEINYLAVLIGGIFAMVLGALWYSPLLFGTMWMKLSGLTEEHLKKQKEKGMMKSYSFMLVCALLVSYIMAHFVGALKLTTFEQGTQLGFWLWLGFVAPVLISPVLWEGKSIKLFWINAMYYLVQMVVIAGMLATMGTK